MKVTYDKLADCMYISYQDKKVAFSRDNWDWSIFDFDDFGWLVWIEVIWVSNILQNQKEAKDMLKILQYT